MFRGLTKGELGLIPSFTISTRVSLGLRFLGEEILLDLTVGLGLGVRG
jgi:hypothetical protein